MEKHSINIPSIISKKPNISVPLLLIGTSRKGLPVAGINPTDGLTKAANIILINYSVSAFQYQLVLVNFSFLLVARFPSFTGTVPDKIPEYHKEIPFAYR